MKIFITGGTTGIGLALAESYLKDGHDVGICGRDLSKLPEDFLIRNPKAKGYVVDVLDKETLQNAVNDFAQGKLDIIVANAGRSMGSKTRKPNFDATRDVLNINIMGVVNTFEAAFDIMYEQGHGQMVATASVAGLIGLPGAAAYSGSKAAVLKMCESYALDFKNFGIHVTAIAPGFIKTPLTDKNDHSMPFIMPVEKGARMYRNAIEKKKVLYVFPWQMKCITYLLDKMPRFLYRWIMSLKIANYSKG